MQEIVRFTNLGRDNHVMAAKSKIYVATMRLFEARSLFFVRSGLDTDGGYNARWVRVETKPVPFYFPNTACRVEAAKLHDLHHIAMEYETDWAGEAEIAGWEIASGCGRHLWAWLLNLGAFAVGMILFPKRLFRAFLRGRHSAKNLYCEEVPEAELATKTVGWLRERLGMASDDPPISPRDRTAFAIWCFIAAVYEVALIGAGLICLSTVLSRLHIIPRGLSASTG